LRTFSVALSLATALLLASFAYALSYAPRQVAAIAPPAAGFTPGSPVMIRIFKRESELEVWMLKDERFELYAVYPICYWSGRLGPKEREGDRQAPEGFYFVGVQQLHLVGRHPRSLNIGFPNAFDRALGRSGSHILVHGGCTSVGCFAMTDPVMERIYAVSEQALFAGQDKIQVQIFPFRMTDANLAAHTGSKWYGFWRNLKEGYDSFEETHLPPAVAVCRKSYFIAPENDDQPPTAAECAEGIPVLAAVKPRPKILAAKIKSARARSRHAPRPRATRAAASRSKRAIDAQHAWKVAAEIQERNPYLDRNRGIVRETKMLIAAPVATIE
jgi:murein L,D-transpeptidase YafK